MRGFILKDIRIVSLLLVFVLGFPGIHLYASEKNIYVRGGQSLRQNIESDTTVYSTFVISGNLTTADLDYLGKLLRTNADVKTIDLTNATGVTKIGWGTFHGCMNLENVILPKSLLVLGDFAFANCAKLKSIALPDGLNAVGASCFMGCSELEKVELPASVSQIGRDAFRECMALGMVVMHGAPKINRGAFGNCLLLFDIISYSPKAPVCVEDPFEGVDETACAIKVPQTSIENYKKAKYWKKFKLFYPL